MTDLTKKLIATISLTGYLFLALLGFASFSSHHRADGMSAGPCPYMIGQTSMCAMDAFSHIEAWQNMMRAIVPYFTLLIFVCTVILFTWPELIEIGPPNRLRHRHDRQYSPYVTLFSRGILNPKIP